MLSRLLLVIVIDSFFVLATYSFFKTMSNYGFASMINADIRETLAAQSHLYRLFKISDAANLHVFSKTCRFPEEKAHGITRKHYNKNDEAQ